MFDSHHCIKFRIVAYLVLYLVTLSVIYFSRYEYEDISESDEIMGS